jgi:copper chaperone CopZ
MKKVSTLMIVLTIVSLFFGSSRLNAQTVAPEQGVFKVKVGFHCANGKRLLETKLQEVKGVQKVEVDLETKEVSITHNADEVSTKDLILAIEQIGYYTEFSDKTKPLQKKACTHGDDH